jgi:hypothetical protein
MHGKVEKCGLIEPLVRKWDRPVGRLSMGDKITLIWILKELLAQSVMLLTCVGEVPVSNLAQDAESQFAKRPTIRCCVVS